MTTPNPQPERLRVAHLNARAPTPFSLTPDAPEPLEPLPMIVVIIDELADLMMVAGKKIEELIASVDWFGSGGSAFNVIATPGSAPPSAVNDSAATAEDEPVERHYSPHVTAPEGDEVEMPDDTLEPLGQFIDLAAVMIEELALALPEYPRAEGAELGAARPDPAPDTRRPFEGLDKLLRGRDTDQG